MRLSCYYHEFRHNIVKVAVDPRRDSQVDPLTTLIMIQWNLDLTNLYLTKSSI